MKKILILGMLAIVGCQTTQKSSQIPTSTETKVTTTTSQVTETVVPTPTTLTTLPPLPIPTPTIIQTLPPLLPPLTTQKTPLTIAPNIDKPIPSSQILAANIRSSIGCGVVNEEYRTKVAAMAVALANPKATEQLTETQFYQAVKQNIIKNQAKTNNLVAEFRASNCGAPQNINTKTQKVEKPQKAPTPTDKVILEQSGSCQDLNARGISNINVQINPWAKPLDQDRDGIACKSN